MSNLTVAALCLVTTLFTPVLTLASGYYAPAYGPSYGPVYHSAYGPVYQPAYPPVYRPTPSYSYPSRPGVIVTPARPVEVLPLQPMIGATGRLYTPPARSDDSDEVDAANMMAQAIAGKGCDRAGEALRDLSNHLLASVRFATAPNPFPPAPGDERGRLREEMRQRWIAHLRSSSFWQKVWDRLADAYRGCNRLCFDDGVAIGQISGAGYCGGSVAVGGLNSPGVAFQAPLPLCQNATFTGCQVGYDKAAQSFQGCSTYTSGGYTTIFNEYKSQDCHMDSP